MRVRLGFAVISSLDEPILLVDEVLAQYNEDLGTTRSSAGGGG